MRKFIQMVDQPLEHTQHISKNLENYLPDVIFGPKSL